MTTKSGKPASKAAIKAHTPESLITFRVSVLSQLLSRLVDNAVSEELDLSSRQWRVLVILNRIGAATSGEVARMAHLDHSQVSRVSFELAKLGMLALSNDATDRRKQVLSITPSGLDKLKQGIPGSLARQERLRARLTDDEYDTFCRALDILTDEAQQMHPRGRTKSGE